MKYLIGTDIIEVDRIKESIEKNEISTKVFTSNEIQYCETGKKNKYQRYAARFAAKEAIYKAVSPLLKNNYEISWKNIEVLNDKKGRPIVNFLNTDLDNISIDLSLSHIKEYAIATAIAEIKEGE